MTSVSPKFTIINYDIRKLLTLAGVNVETVTAPDPNDRTIGRRLSTPPPRENAFRLIPDSILCNGYRICTKFDYSRPKFNQAIRKLNLQGLSRPELYAYDSGINICDRDVVNNLIDYTNAFKNLIGVKLTDEQLQIYTNALRVEFRHQNITSYTTVFQQIVETLRLSQPQYKHPRKFALPKIFSFHKPSPERIAHANLINEELSTKLEIYLAGLRVCGKSNGKYQKADYIRAFKAILKTEPTDEELSTKLEIYFAGIEACTTEKINQSKFIDHFIRLAPTKIDPKELFINSLTLALAA